MHASYSKKKKLFYYIKVDVKVKQNRGTVFWYFVVHKEVMEEGFFLYGRFQREDNRGFSASERYNNGHCCRMLQG